MEHEIKCPECGSTEIGKGNLDGYALLRPADKMFSLGSPIIVELCTNCGLVINLRVKKPEKFK